MNCCVLFFLHFSVAIYLAFVLCLLGGGRRIPGLGMFSEIGNSSQDLGG